MTVAVFLILRALRARGSKSEPGYAVSSSEPERERARLRSALRESEREREGLRSELQKSERERERLRSKLREGEREREGLRSELREGKRERQRLRSELQKSEREQEQLRSELQKGEQERPRSDPREDEQERLRSENERLRAERDALEAKVTAHEDRVALRQALGTAYRDGLHLRGRTPGRRRKTGRGRTFDDEAAAKWAIRTSELIKETLGEGEARRSLGADGRRAGDLSATEEQKRLNDRLNRLSELIQRVNSLQPLELQPGFEDRERAGSQ